MIIKHATIHIHAASHQDEPNIVMTNADFIAGYEQAINSREFRATQYFTDGDISGIIQDFIAEKHDEKDLQYHAGQLTGLIAVRCLSAAYPLEVNEHVPLQGKTHAPVRPAQDTDAPAYGTVVHSSEWPEGVIDFVLDNSKERGLDLEMSFMTHDAVDAVPSALMHLKKHDIIALRDFLNQAVVTRWLDA